jgi:hypothetical protein
MIYEDSANLNVCGKDYESMFRLDATLKNDIGSSSIESVYQADTFYYPTINELPVETVEVALISRYNNQRLS